MDYLASSDVVVASAGDNSCHEIARAGRPFLCIPKCPYYDEQAAKGRELAARLGAAHVLAGWPASNGQWQQAIAAASHLGTARLKPLFDPDAPKKIAAHLIDLDRGL